MQKAKCCEQCKTFFGAILDIKADKFNSLSVGCLYRRAHWERRVPTG